MQKGGISDKKIKTAPKKFNPFTDRLSRDIRNSLSEAFVKSLKGMDQGYYRQLSHEWLSKNLAPIYNDYIKDHLQRYDLVFDQIQRNRLTDKLLQILIIWNGGLFFEVHDLLESIWHQTTGDEHQALKGLIKAAGVYIHMEYHHQKAGDSLAAKSSNLMRRYSHCLTFIANLNVLLKKLDNLDPVPPELENPATFTG